MHVYFREKWNEGVDWFELVLRICKKLMLIFMQDSFWDHATFTHYKVRAHKNVSQMFVKMVISLDVWLFWYFCIIWHFLMWTIPKSVSLCKTIKKSHIQRYDDFENHLLHMFMSSAIYWNLAKWSLLHWEQI